MRDSRLITSVAGKVLFLRRVPPPAPISSVAGIPIRLDELGEIVISYLVASNHFNHFNLDLPR
ncbi:hypothetical protein DCAR_0101637 [Daucus carota subsp. sativus]|uniref:Uncharacterized protein n=1 Tax=Daucus carota subsp. sativus TaxID=79200 RepID=A0A166GJ84_DAUCS|nr:hypothetical protein DCAR_0101637 [Daucus carota subsp. sativus]